MGAHAEIFITVLSPEISGHGRERAGRCELLVKSTSPLPRGVYAGTVRVAAREQNATGAHPCRLLKHFRIERLRDALEGVLYAMSVDLGDEDTSAAHRYAAPGVGTRRPDEPIETVCGRIAGIFGRHCEGYRPPSVVVDVEGR